MQLSQTEPQKEKKKILRRECATIRASLPSDERLKKTDSIVSFILGLDCFKSADTLLLYYPVRDEIDLKGLAEAALKDGKKIAFPISCPDTSELDFRYVSSLDELSSGTYGIPEPTAAHKKITFQDRILCVVPALAFDLDGFRLGYGRGYYDRFLDKFEGITIGAVFSELLFDELPIDEHDLPVDLIVTEKEVYAPYVAE